MTPEPRPRIVVGIDGSSAGLGALRWALLKGQELGAVVEVIHCWHPHRLTDLVFGTPQELRIGSECMIQNEVDAACAATGATTDVMQTSVHGRPAPVLIEHARHASMLILGTQGHSRRAELIVGSTATRCRRGAACPVVIIGADGRELIEAPHRRTLGDRQRVAH